MTSTPASSPIQRIFEEAFNQGDLAVVDDVLSPYHLTHNAFSGAPRGSQGLKGLIMMFRAAFPDIRCTVEDEISVGDKVAARWVMRGTQRGLFMGNQPTGRLVEIQGIIFARLENGRILEDWTLIDRMGILQQLGIVPPSGWYER